MTATKRIPLKQNEMEIKPKSIFYTGNSTRRLHRILIISATCFALKSVVGADYGRIKIIRNEI